MWKIQLWNPFKRDKKKSKFDKIDKENLEAFLAEITKSVDFTFSGQESIQLEKKMKNEVQVWLKETIFSGKQLDPAAIKLGVCIGIQETLRKINETEEQERVTYIS